MLKRNLITEQQSDSKLTQFISKARPGDNLDNIPQSYYNKNSVLMRTWKPPQIPDLEDWETCEQIIVPRAYKDSSQNSISRAPRNE